jgi:hypothetical protein
MIKDHHSAADDREQAACIMELRQEDKIDEI